MYAGVLAAVTAVNICLSFGYLEESRLSVQKGVCTKNTMTKGLLERSVLKSSAGKDVLCDTVTDGGGWIVLMRRYQGENFTRPWADYKNGFGSFDFDFWLGLDEISSLTSRGTWLLRIDMRFNRVYYFITYVGFKVDGEDKQYTLHVGTYGVGNVRDDLSNHDNMKFYTWDSPIKSSCSQSYKGGWWFNGCHLVYLTGVWKSDEACKGLHWDGLTTSKRNLESVEMKIRLY
ncbi:ficolin-1-A-like [Physella acuta]|uniref:ficolin-1-A-like n=1 Tax=Physella acuta TaxID=109671 RepID=UPI0027DE3E71|nr:ficolin-1-A-like [Physella acuta]